MNAHTEGRLDVWQVKGSNNAELVSKANGVALLVVASARSRADANRLVACWNCMDGLTTDDVLEIGKAGFQKIAASAVQASYKVRDSESLIAEKDSLLDRSVEMLEGASAHIGKLEADLAAARAVMLHALAAIDAAHGRGNKTELRPAADALRAALSKQDADLAAARRAAA